MNPNNLLERLREIHTVGNSHFDFENMLESFCNLDIALRNGESAPDSWNNSYTKAHRQIGNTPNVVVNEMRELYHSGGSSAHFYQFKELFLILDLWLQDGGNPPEDWEGAFNDKSFDRKSLQRKGL